MTPSALHLPGKIAALAAALFCGISVSDPGHGQAPLTNSGTLTCTVATVPDKPAAVVELSCNFKSQSGVTSDYVGTAETKTGGFPPTKHVFVWTVVGTDAEKPPMLDGTFAAKAGQQGLAVLTGGTRDPIRLEPVAGKEQLAGPTEITTLTLKLSATKT